MRAPQRKDFIPDKACLPLFKFAAKWHAAWVINSMQIVHSYCSLMLCYALRKTGNGHIIMFLTCPSVHVSICNVCFSVRITKEPLGEISWNHRNIIILYLKIKGWVVFPRLWNSRLWSITLYWIKILTSLLLLSSRNCQKKLEITWSHK